MIQLHPSVFINVECHDFALEQKEGCVFDYMEVLAGVSSDAPVIGRYCGIHNETLIFARQGNISIKFVSDKDKEFGGFHCTYKVGKGKRNSFISLIGKERKIGRKFVAWGLGNPQSRGKLYEKYITLRETGEVKMLYVQKCHPRRSLITNKCLGLNSADYWYLTLQTIFLGAQETIGFRLIWPVLYTAISRKFVKNKVHATIPKGNMGYDQYPVSNDCSCRTYFCYFPSALANIYQWPPVRFF